VEENPLVPRYVESTEIIHRHISEVHIQRQRTYLLGNCALETVLTNHRHGHMDPGTNFETSHDVPDITVSFPCNRKATPLSTPLESASCPLIRLIREESHAFSTPIKSPRYRLLRRASSQNRSTREMRSDSDLNPPQALPPKRTTACAHASRSSRGLMSQRRSSFFSVRHAAAELRRNWKRS
jgi:hypothetical protein